MTARVLVLRALGLGDYLTGVPALRAVRRALPEHQLCLAAPAVLAPLVELSRSVDRLVPTGELQPVPWSWQPPEVAIDLHGNGPASKAVLQRLRPRRLVAFAGPGPDGRHVAGPPWDADEHERRRWCRLVDAAFGTTSDADDLHLCPPSVPSPAPGAVVLHVGAASGARRWPARRFAAVARWAVRAGAEVVLTGTAGERRLAALVCREAGLASAHCLAGATSLTQLAALVAEARLVVCGDTGVAHLASAYATPSVVLFGPTPPARWGPPETGPHDAVWLGTGPGDPHGDTPHPALLRITVEEVLERAALRSGLAPRS